MFTKIEDVREAGATLVDRCSVNRDLDAEASLSLAYGPRETEHDRHDN
jgi:hypothetical protein